VIRTISSVFLLAAAVCAQPRVTPIVFDESATDRIRISAPAYELALAKSDGAILGIRDRAAGVEVTSGSRNGCVWATNRGGCIASGFHYFWNNAQHFLTLFYSDATVTVSPAEDYFDLQLNLQNHAGGVIDSVALPAELMFETAAIHAAYLPYFLPGVKLEPSFFAAHKSFTATYPGTRSFADYMALEANGGRIAWYAVNPAGRIAPVSLGFRASPSQPGRFYALHNFQTWIRDGAKYSSPVVRVRVGQTVERTMLSYRAENGIDRYPSIAAKLGDRFQTVAQAPMVKMDFHIMRRTFAEAAARLRETIEPPALLHPVAYWERAFDQNYPDFLPPNQQFGSTKDFRDFVAEAHRLGMFVMPYTNPTWWDDQSPTAKSVSDLSVFAALGKDGKPIFESYGPNHGFVASPSAPATGQRLARLMAGWKDEVPMDFVFQDQIGSRSWLRDFQPGGDSPQDYSEQWLKFTATYASSNLMTEDGWDRLAATETGFCGSELSGATKWDPQGVRWGADNRANKVFGPGNWRPYPLGDWLFHDKVLFYHHDLSHPAMNAGIEVLAWNAAFGVMAGYLWPDFGGINRDWIKLANAFQRAVFARTAGQTLASYRELAPEVTESRFGDLRTVANWDASKSYADGGFTIAPSGFLAASGDGTLLAGAFVERFNGAPLSAGVHYLVVERGVRGLSVRQPVGGDTEVRIQAPREWKRMKLTADGKPVDSRMDNGSIVFLCSARVSRYQLTPQ
jgi:hypothetical protein